MLLNDFYTIEALDRVEAAHAVLRLNAAHPIFAGHFPGQPVVPGACQLQIIQEVLSHVLGNEYRLLKGDQVKFLMPIDPRRHPRIEATLRYSAVAVSADADGGAAMAKAGAGGGATTAKGDLLQVTASLSAGETIFLKFTGIFGAE